MTQHVQKLAEAFPVHNQFIPHMIVELKHVAEQTAIKGDWDEFQVAASDLIHESKNEMRRNEAYSRLFLQDLEDWFRECNQNLPWIRVMVYAFFAWVEQIFSVEDVK